MPFPKLTRTVARINFNTPGFADILVGTSITFHGGVQDIGGNKFLVKDRDTTLLMDFGMSFNEEKRFFAQFMKARTSNALEDMFSLGLLPKIEGLYRQDYAKHVGFEDSKENKIDGLLLTHAHLDHCAYIKYLRNDIPIYCTEASRLILQNFDDTGNNEYTHMKEKFIVYDNQKGEKSIREGKKARRERTFVPITPGKEISIDSISVKPLAVDHSIPGACAFILYTSNGSIANTGDLRFHGRRKDETERFVEECSESNLDYLLCEGTRVEKNSSITEYDIEGQVADIMAKADGLALCGYPMRDLDRLQSFYLAAKRANRYLVIDMKQAYLLNLFDESENLRGIYPSAKDEHIKVYIPKRENGLIDKDIEHYTRKLLLQDYESWQKPFLDYQNKVIYQDIHAKQKDFLLFCNDYHLQELIDIKPDAGATYIRSQTEPFDIEMELKTEQIKNWLTHFGIIGKERDWHQIHVSGHGDGTQIKRVIDGAKSKKLVPIHTKKDSYHKKWHDNVIGVNQHDTITL